MRNRKRKGSLGALIALLGITALISSGSVVWLRLHQDNRGGLAVVTARPIPASRSRSVKIGHPAKLFSSVHGEKVTVVRPTPGGELAIGTYSGKVYLASMSEARMRRFRQVAGLSLPVRDIAISSDGKSIAALFNDWTTAQVAVYRPGHAVTVIQVLDPSEADVIGLDEGAGKVAVGAFDVTVYDVVTSRVLWTLTFPPLEGGSSAASSIAFKSNGDIVMLASEGVQVARPGRTGITMGLCGCDSLEEVLDPSTDHAIFKSRSGHLIVIDVNTGETVADKTLSADHEDYFYISVDRVGRRVLAAASSGRFVLWDVNRNTVIERGSFPKGFFLVDFIDDHHLLLERGAESSVGYWVSSM